LFVTFHAYAYGCFTTFTTNKKYKPEQPNKKYKPEQPIKDTNLSNEHV